MISELHKLDFVDLLSERHVQIRSITEQLWNETSDLYVSNSEWYIMASIYKKMSTISSVSKRVDISRQATHKFVKRLESKGLVSISSLENNKKDKCIELTKLGEECYEKNETLKASLEKQIAEKIGVENLETLKGILMLDWGV